MFPGTTDARGLVEREQATLKLWSGVAKTPELLVKEITLHPGCLAPLDEVAGMQARLRNLAFECGPLVGTMGPKTRAGVKAFQKAHNLAVDGIAGPITRGELEKVHGC